MGDSLINSCRILSWTWSSNCMRSSIFPHSGPVSKLKATLPATSAGSNRARCLAHRWSCINGTDDVRKKEKKRERKHSRVSWQDYVANIKVGIEEKSLRDIWNYQMFWVIVEFNLPRENIKSMAPGIEPRRSQDVHRFGPIHFHSTSSWYPLHCQSAQPAKRWDKTKENKIKIGTSGYIQCNLIDGLKFRI